MEWRLEPRDPAAVPRLRREITAYLRRHASPGADTDGSELVISEMLANAFEHADGPAWVSVRWDELHPVISVTSLGPGFPPHLLGRHSPGATRPDPVSGGGRGLFLAAHLARDLDIAARTAGGSVVRATLDVTRDQQETVTPPHPSATPLPLLDEARPDGAFDRETLLRAMVVQLMQVIDLQHGPQAAQAAINQVGADVGRQLEAEFRIARTPAGRLTPEELADCLVRMKRAIGEEFQIIEASQARLVLTGSRCPFGDAVRREPSLCQMMAGVIGGIATRNVPCGEAAVLMEERIAIGDPACRIVVWLDPDEAATSAGALRFLAPDEHASSPSGR